MAYFSLKKWNFTVCFIVNIAKRRNIMKQIVYILAAAVFFTGMAFDVRAQEAETIQMAILLDTSSSMDGLIDQAKTNLWKIVNETAKAKKGGKAPKLQVALYEYGNDSISAETGYIRKVTALTADLDLVSEKLFALTTNGGSEYCGQVIEKAVKDLSWNKKNDVYKVIYIAGNEPFSQGDTDYKKACKTSISSGIIVNTIYCGGASDSDAATWKDGASLADGSFMSIDQNQKVADIVAPQDAQILSLNEELNKTYIAYGSGGYEKKERQAAQDSNSKMMANEAAVQRTMAKAAPAYSNSGWDLVDAEKDGAVSVDKMKEDELPDEMKKMSAAERKTYIEKKKKDREQIQGKIKKLSEERQKYVEKEMKKQSSDNTLDAAIIKSIRKQAVKKGYTFE